MANSAIWVETVELDVTEGRQVSSRRRTRELLQERRSEIEAAISEAAGIVRAAAERTPDEAGWRTTSIEATFGITVAAETGVVLTKASAEASLEVKITIERR